MPTDRIVDPVLGELVYDHELDQYDGGLEHDTGPIRIALTVTDDAALEAGLERARIVIRTLRDYDQRAKRWMTTSLLPLKNRTWLGENEAPVTPVDFESRLRLEAIDVNSDREVRFWYEDGELFWGHSIELFMDADDKFDEPTIAG